MQKSDANEGKQQGASPTTYTAHLCPGFSTPLCTCAWMRVCEERSTVLSQSPAGREWTVSLLMQGVKRPIGKCLLVPKPLLQTFLLLSVPWMSQIHAFDSWLHVEGLWCRNHRLCTWGWHLLWLTCTTTACHMTDILYACTTPLACSACATGRWCVNSWQKAEPRHAFRNAAKLHRATFSGL